MERSAAARRAAVALVAVSMGWASAPAWGSTASAERQGAALTKTVDTGERSRRSLSAAERDRIGEYAMGLGFTTGAQHDAMNARMQTMMGAAGERQAHRAMGGSYSGCAANAAQDGSSGTDMMGGYGALPTMMSGGDYGPGMARSTAADDGGLGTVPGRAHRAGRGGARSGAGGVLGASAAAAPVGLRPALVVSFEACAGVSSVEAPDP